MKVTINNSSIALLIGTTILLIMSGCYEKDEITGDFFTLSKRECITLKGDFEYNYSDQTGLTTYAGKSNGVVSHLSNGKLYSFDIASGELTERRYINVLGPQSVGATNSFCGAVIHDVDKMLYANNPENKVLLITPDTVSVVVDYSFETKFRLFNTAQNRPVVSPHHYLFALYPGSKENVGRRKTYLAIDKNLEKSREVIFADHVYSSIFSHGAAPYLYWPSVIYNSKKSTYIVSFPVDHRLFEYDTDFNLIKTHNIFHEEIGVIEEFDKPLNEYGEPNYEDSNDYFRRVNYFEQLHYIKGTDQIVRIARKKDSETLENSFLLFVYDSSIEHSSTFKVDSFYNVYNTFSSEGNLYMLNESRIIDERNGDIPFDCFTFSAN